MITTSARRLVAVLAVCVLALLTAPSGAASAAPSKPAVRTDAGGQERTTFGVQPSGAKKPDQRPNFSYGVTPGAAVRDHIAVWNYGTKPLTLRVYAGDAFTTADGGFDLFAAGRRPTGAGSWVKLGTQQVTVKSRSRVIIPFELKVPRGATPGDHAGGVVASLAGVSTDAKGDRVKVDQRVGARIYVRVAGALKPGLTVGSVHATYHGTANPFGSGSATVTYIVRNTGNVRLGARQTVRVGDLFGGLTTAPRPRDIAELLPGDSLTVTTSAAGVPPTLRDKATVTVEPVPVKGDVVRSALAQATRSAGFWAVPWVFLALVLLVAVAGTALFLRRRRRSGPGTGSAARPAGTVPAQGAKARDTAVAGAAGRAPRPLPSKKRTSTTARRTGGRAAARTDPAWQPLSYPRRFAALPAAALLTGVVVLAAPGAQAAPADGLTVSPRHGSDTQPITLTASEPCPRGAVNVIARIVGAGFPRGGQIVVGNGPLATYPKAPGAGPVIPLTFTLRDYATTAGFRELRGTYTFTLTCLKGAFGMTSLKDFTGSLRFTSGAAYRDGTEAAAPPRTASGQPSEGPSGSGAGSGAGSGPGGTQAASDPAAAPGGAAPSRGASGTATPDRETATADPEPAVAGGPAPGSNTAAVVFSLGGFAAALVVVLVGAARRARRRRGPATRTGSHD